MFWQGEPAAARTHLTQALALYDPQAHRALAVRYGLDLGVAAGGILARALWALGFPDAGPPAQPGGAAPWRRRWRTP